MSTFADIPENERRRHTNRVHIKEAYDDGAGGANSEARGINRATRDDLVEAITSLADSATEKNEVLLAESIDVGPARSGLYDDEHGRTFYDVTADSVTIDIWKIYQPRAQREHGAP